MSNLPTTLATSIPGSKFSHLNPVLGFNRVSLTTWARRVEVANYGPVDVLCTTKIGQTVPHGLDGDVLFAVQTLYYHRGDEGKRSITTNLSELCRHAGLRPSDYAYQRIRKALKRLQEAQFTAEACFPHHDCVDYQSTSFRLLNQVTFRSVSAEKNEIDTRFTVETEVVIELSREVADSTVVGPVTLLSAVLYERLSQPLSRLLYRVLEVTRNQEEQVTFALADWAEHLGLLDSALTNLNDLQTHTLKPSRIKRALEPAHQDLIDCGYLKRVDYMGAVRRSLVTYTFNNLPRTSVESASTSKHADMALILFLHCAVAGYPPAGDRP